MTTTRLLNVKQKQPQYLGDYKEVSVAQIDIQALTEQPTTKSSRIETLFENNKNKDVLGIVKETLGFFNQFKLRGLNKKFNLLFQSNNIRVTKDANEKIKEALRSLQFELENYNRPHRDVLLRDPCSGRRWLSSSCFRIARNREEIISAKTPDDIRALQLEKNSTINLGLSYCLFGFIPASSLTLCASFALICASTCSFNDSVIITAKNLWAAGTIFEITAGAGCALGMVVLCSGRLLLEYIFDKDKIISLQELQQNTKQITAINNSLAELQKISKIQSPSMER